MNTLSDKKKVNRTERGQAIVLIAFAFIGLVAMVGLVTDTALLLIEYGKLKRSVDAAAVAAAQEFRPDPDTGDLNATAMQNAALSLLQVNQMNNVSNITVHTCEDTGADRPSLCNPDPVGNPIENRKLVEVSAVSEVTFAFLRVLGINSVNLTVSSVGEAATIDLVLIIDTSGSMAYETDPGGDPTKPNPGDNPIACNLADDCQPLREVKNVALEFVDSLIYFGYDRVAVIAMTEQASGPTDFVERDPVEVLPLSFDRNLIFFSIDTLKVFQPRICQDPLPYDPGDALPGECLQFVGGSYNKPICEAFQSAIDRTDDDGIRAIADPSSCPSSNIGGTMTLAQDAFSGSGTAGNQRTDSLWVTVMLASGPANASTPSEADETDYPNGYCPQNTWLYPFMPDPKTIGWCRDAVPGNERSAASAMVPYINPINGAVMDEISLYDAEDYARDMADNLAAMKSGSGVTIYTIGLGEGVAKEANGTPAVSCQIAVSGGGTRPCGEAEHILTYVSRTAGDSLNPEINHGEYFFAPTSATLRNIFEIIAQNIATKISQ